MNDIVELNLKDEILKKLSSTDYEFLKNDSRLNDNIDYDKVNDFVASVNERIILNRR